MTSTLCRLHDLLVFTGSPFLEIQQKLVVVVDLVPPQRFAEEVRGKLLALAGPSGLAFAASPSATSLSAAPTSHIFTAGLGTAVVGLTSTSFPS